MIHKAQFNDFMSKYSNNNGTKAGSSQKVTKQSAITSSGSAINCVNSPTTVKKKKRRVFNGCWTCRIRKVKCDLQKPVCRNCKILNIECKGYGVRLRWYPIQSYDPKTFDLIIIDSDKADDGVVADSKSRDASLLSANPLKTHRSMIESVQWKRPYRSYEEIDDDLQSINDERNRRDQTIKGPFTVFSASQVVTSPINKIRLFRSQSPSKVSITDHSPVEDGNAEDIISGSGNYISNDSIKPVDSGDITTTSNHHTYVLDNLKLLETYNRHTDFLLFNNKGELKNISTLGDLKAAYSEKQVILENISLKADLQVKRWVDVSLVKYYLISTSFKKDVKGERVIILNSLSATQKEIVGEDFLSGIICVGQLIHFGAILAFKSLDKVLYENDATNGKPCFHLNTGFIKKLLRNFTEMVLPKLTNFTPAGQSYWETLIWKTELLPILSEFLLEDGYFVNVNNFVYGHNKVTTVNFKISIMKSCLVLVILCASSFNLYCSQSTNTNHLVLAINLNQLTDTIVVNVLKHIIDEDQNDLDCDHWMESFKNKYTLGSVLEAVPNLLKLIFLYLLIKIHFDNMMDIDYNYKKWFKYGNMLIEAFQYIDSMVVANEHTNLLSFNDNLYNDFLDFDLSCSGQQNTISDVYYLIKIFRILEIFYECTSIYDLQDFEVFRIEKFKQEFDELIVAENNEENRAFTSTKTEDSLFKTTISVLDGGGVVAQGVVSPLFSTVAQKTGVKEIDVYNTYIPRMLKDNFMGKLNMIYRSNDNENYDINDDYEFNDDEDPVPPTFEISFQYGESNNNSSSKTISESDRSPAATENSDYIDGKPVEGEKKSLCKLDFGPHNSTIKKNIDLMLELSFGIPLSLLKLFQLIVKLIKHQFYFFVHEIHLRIFPKVCSDIEDRLLSWKLGWDLFVEEDDEGKPKRKRFHSINHEILYHNIMSFYHALIVYYFTLVKDVPFTFLKLHQVKILEHLNYLKYVLKPDKRKGTEVSSASSESEQPPEFYTFRPQFFAIFIVAVENNDAVLQNNVKQLMEFYERHWQSHELALHWQAKQVVYETWRLRRAASTTGDKSDEEVSWVDVARTLLERLRLFCV